MSPDDPWEPSGEARPSGRARAGGSSSTRTRLQGALRQEPVRGRRVRRTLRHVDPWSVLRLSLLFHAAVFLIICVASAVLWTGARASGSLDNLEDFVTSVGGFGNCEPVGGARATTTTTTSTTVAEGEDGDDGQLGAGGSTTSEPEVVTDDTLVGEEDDEDCRAGEELVGGFEFEDTRIFGAFAFGGILMVLAGAGASVVLVLLFNLMSDLTGGVQVWIVEDEPRRRRPDDAGSPPSRRRG